MTEMLYLDLEDFLKIPDGETFASGSAPDSPGGLHMTGSGKILYWVAVKGHAQDWVMYCGWGSDEWHLRNCGDKVRGVENILNVIDASDEVLARYRR